MAFRKYQKVEKVEVESKDDSQRIREGVASLGKTSASQLTPSEKRTVIDQSK